VRHFWRTIRVAVSVLVAALPVVLADPAVRDLIAAHPWLAGYFPVATAVVYAIYRAARPAASPDTLTGPGGGSPTMGAK
jgi:hypothetical protein